MNFKSVISFKDLQTELKKSEKLFLLLYKSGSEQSDCAYQNLNELKTDNKEINLLIADVSKVKDIHEKFQINSVPAFLEFENTKHTKTTKGCHKPEFFKSMLDNNLYAATNKEDDKKVKRVIVYSTQTCPHCTTLKNYLKDNRIAFRDIDVSKDQKMAEQMVKRTGQQGVPQIDINGRQIVGFDKPKIDELLEIR